MPHAYFLNQIALRGCSINTWGCRSLAACVVDTITGRKCINSDINTKVIAEARVPLVRRNLKQKNAAAHLQIRIGNSVDRSTKSKQVTL